MKIATFNISGISSRLLNQGYVPLNAQLAPALVDAGVDAWVRGEPKASDHAPVWMELKVPRPRARKKAVQR